MINFNSIKTYPIRERKNKVTIRDFAKPVLPDRSFQNFLDHLPEFLAVKNIKSVASAIAQAYRKSKPVILAMGGHVVKVGLSPLIIDLMRRKIITAVAMNGSGAIHDYEISLIGETSEDVAEEIKTGRFGMAEETGRALNEAAHIGMKNNIGYGNAAGKLIIDEKNPHTPFSILAAGFENNIPVTVHIALGTDIIHMHPSADGKALGEATFHDYRKLTDVICGLDGGVWINLGSAVILPEIFVKAVSVARNLGYPLNNITTVNMDMVQHYRPTENVVQRPTLGSGSGYAITGHHEIMFPLLRMMTLCELGIFEK